MAANPLNLVVILGSTREGRQGEKVASWFLSEADKHRSFTVTFIDVAELEFLGSRPMKSNNEIAGFAAQLGAADAFVIVAAEYNHSYTGHLKHAIDQATTEWKAKPVGFVSYGGVSGGLRAVEHLRQVFAELHAVSVRECVSFHGVWDLFDDAGILKNGTGPATAAHVLLNQLAWWAAPLRVARAATPYCS